MATHRAMVAATLKTQSLSVGQNGADQAAAGISPWSTCFGLRQPTLNGSLKHPDRNRMKHWVESILNPL